LSPLGFCELLNKEIGSVPWMPDTLWGSITNSSDLSYSELSEDWVQLIGIVENSSIIWEKFGSAACCWEGSVQIHVLSLRG
jgi:hypothetical protein